MGYNFRPANTIKERHGLFVALVGGTNSGKTFSALRLARGIAGPAGRIAVADTEGGRTLHLKNEFAFDFVMMEPPHRPANYAQVAIDAEKAGYHALVIDSFSAEWAGIGGVLSWADDEAQRMAGDDQAKRERVKGATWIKPKQAHKAMVYSLLERRMPIIFSIRGEETFVPPNTKLFKPVCNKGFLFEVTVSFRLRQDAKGIIDLSDPNTYKMEGVHKDIFRDGEQLGEQHGAALAAWASGGARDDAATGEAGDRATEVLFARAQEAAEAGSESYRAWWSRLTPRDKRAIAPSHETLKAVATAADGAAPGFDDPGPAPAAPAAEPATVTA